MMRKPIRFDRHHRTSDGRSKHREFYCCSCIYNRLGSPVLQPGMHRLTARFLLLVTLLGSLGPLAIAASAISPHACCLRKAAHPCHDSTSSQLGIRAAGCCSNSSPVATTPQWAHSASPPAAFLAFTVEASTASLNPARPNTRALHSSSPRAPPFSIS